jgi:3-phosphoshikimate 1-carboxyvinyltransferase
MITVRREGTHLSGTVALTASKSITNRVLIIRALSDEKFDISNKATANDSKILEEILETLTPEINVEDAGTVFRFLTAYLSIQPGTFILSGNDRMKHRPVGALVDAMRSIGADISYGGEEHYPPVIIAGKELRGGSTSIDASVSSQFVSALLLIAPKLSTGLKLELVGKIASKPYILMTLSLMQYFNVKIKTEGSYISIARQSYMAQPFFVENDWSAASFWYILAAQAESAEILLKGLQRSSVQGDSVISSILEAFGVKSQQAEGGMLITKSSASVPPDVFRYDFTGSPDLVIPLAVLCASLGVPSEFTGVRNLRIKESDRLLALKLELKKTGTMMIIEEDSFTIRPSVDFKTDEIIDCHNDHRMAMAFATLAMRFSNVFINNHLAVNKSYPEFWDQLSRTGFRLEIF